MSIYSRHEFYRIHKSTIRGLMVRSRSSSPDDDRYVKKSNRRSNSRERERSYKYSHRDDAQYHNNRRSRSRSPLKQTTQSQSRSPKHHLTKPGSHDYHRENGHSSHHGHHHQQQGHTNNKLKVPDFFDRYVIIFFIMSYILYESDYKYIYLHRQ